MQPECQVTSPVPAPADPTTTEVRAELDRIVASPMFQSSPTLTAFFRFIVERCLAGDSAHIKAYTVAVDGLGRDADFDPQVDPIVRVEAGRLRRKLARYYAEEGADDPVVVDLPRGCYVPVFRTRAGSDSAPTTNGHAPAGRALPYDASTSRQADVAALDVAFERLVRRCRIQLEAMAAEVETAERMLAQWRRMARQRG